MAKTSMINREIKRKKLNKQHGAKREALKKILPFKPTAAQKRVLAEIAGVRLIGTAPDKASVLSFVVDGIHAHDLGTIVDSEGVAIRTGHHCAMPVMERFGVAATARASFAFYNNNDDVDRLLAGLEKAVEIFRG